MGSPYKIDMSKLKLHFENQPSLDDSICDFEHDDAINSPKCNFNLDISIL
jgi:hypothetical protein